MRRERSYWLRLTRLSLAALGAGVLMAYVGYYLLTDVAYIHFLTHPGCGEMGVAPADVGLTTARHVTYPSHDGLTLRAWYLPPRNGIVLILLPGLGGARDGMLQEGAILSRHGYGLLMTELRSCAHPDGETTLGYYEARDLVRAVDWVVAQPDVAHVGVLGYSMGGVAAILGAAQDARLEAVVAEGGFYDLVADLTDSDKDLPLSRRLLYGLHPWLFRRETGVDPGLVSPISVIAQISPRPVFLIYGEHEAAGGHAWEQYQAAGEPKSLWIVPNCGHGSYHLVAPEEWEERVVGFFNEQWDNGAMNNGGNGTMSNEAMNNEAMNNEAMNNEAMNNEAMSSGAMDNLCSGDKILSKEVVLCDPYMLYRAGSPSSRRLGPTRLSRRW